MRAESDEIRVHPFLFWQEISSSQQPHMRHIDSKETCSRELVTYWRRWPWHDWRKCARHQGSSVNWRLKISWTCLPESAKYGLPNDSCHFVFKILTIFDGKKYLKFFFYVFLLACHRIIRAISHLKSSLKQSLLVVKDNSSFFQESFYFLS